MNNNNYTIFFINNNVNGTLCLDISVVQKTLLCDHLHNPQLLCRCLSVYDYNLHYLPKVSLTAAINRLFLTVTIIINYTYFNTPIIIYTRGYSSRISNQLKIPKASK